MDPAHPILSNITSASFSPLISSDIRAISVLQITNPNLLDSKNEPNIGGLYDPRLGPLHWKDICRTCSLLNSQCPGHFGHIELNVPVFHPLFMRHAFQILRATCFYCHHFLCSEMIVIRYCAKLILLNNGLLIESNLIDDFPTAPEVKAGKRPLPEELNANGEAEFPLEEKQLNQRGGGDASFYKSILSKFVDECLRRKQATENPDLINDDYKIGMCYDRRRQVISDLIKLLPKKRCERCGAFSSRMRKDGHTKIMEYSLVEKQAEIHRLTRKIRPDVLQDDANGAGPRRNSVKKVANCKKRRRKHRSPTAVDVSSDSDQSSDASAWAQNPKSNIGSSDSEGGILDHQTNGSGNSDDSQATEEEEEEEEEDDGDEELFDNEEEKGMGPKRLQTKSQAKKTKQTERMMLAQEVRAHLRRLFQNEHELCGLLFGAHGPAQRLTHTSITADMFFLDVVPVPPSRFRPAVIMGGQTMESPQNQLLADILSQTIKLRDLNNELSAASAKPHSQISLRREELEALRLNRTKLYSQILEACVGMQVAVNSLMDSTKNPAVMGPGKLPPAGIKQLLEKKEGLFRMNMMGKRVNYAARSVISPDVNIETNEIGVPPVFAKKLTFPEFVTAHNFEQMHRLVCNGPHKHPGAVYVQDENGAMISLDKMDEEARKALANTLLNTSSDADRYGKLSRPDVGLPSTRTPMRSKRVHRHLDNGDILILNRQPTLHKPSMMCHRARILKGEKTIRMHYANCNSYNADFDGDEMNMHFPQSLVAQSEARTIANNDNQYLVPTSGNPLRGLIQDHIVAGVWMTNKDTFFNRDNYYQIIYGALRPEGNYSGQGRVLTMPPAIWKPQPLWTGKQIISTIMKNITPLEAFGLNLFSTSKVPGKAWGIHSAEESVIFYDGNLLCGVIDKSQIGASSYGLIHSVYDLYGAEVAGRLLGILSRLFTKFLQHRAFTCRMDDLQLTKRGNDIRSKLISETTQRGIKATLSTVGMLEKEVTTPQGMLDLENRLQEILRDDMKMAALDNAYSGENSSLQTEINKQCLPSGLSKPFPWNNMQMMTGSGAKGTPVNASQISCLLGQQALEGRRVPVMVSGKTLPSFRAFETAPRAGGFVAQRFLTGIRPQEYFFHCMAGREGLIDTAVKTSRSGYLQRCLIKHLEGVRVHYDHTVRNSDASVLQFHYGDDSLDVTKQKHLYQFSFSLLNRASLIQHFKPSQIIDKVDSEIAVNHGEQLLKALRIGAQLLSPPTLSLYSPSRYLGSVSERFEREVYEYQQSNPMRILKSRKHIRKHWPAYIKSNQLVPMQLFRSLMHVRFMKGLVDPGEVVGLLASQGVGEPSTQMTLNTFHFAGHGAANVTLGIPRLREIVMTASTNIKTPTMKFPIREEVSDEEFALFIKQTAKLRLSEVVNEVVVNERLTGKQNGARYKAYEICLRLYPSEEYCSEYNIKVDTVFKSIVRAFIPLLERTITRELKTRQNDIKTQFAEIGKGRSTQTKGANSSREDEDIEVEGNDDENAPVREWDEADIEDGDAGDEKRARQKGEVCDYDKDGAESDEDEDAMDDEKLRRLTGANGTHDEDDDASLSIADTEEAEKLEELENRQITIRQLGQEVEESAKYITSIKFDDEGGEYCQFTMQFPSTSHKLLLVGLIEKCCRSAVIQEIPGISRALVSKPDNPHEDRTRYGMTEGANLTAAWDFGWGIIDLNHLYSNDINAILKTYGVEAARSAIIKEMSAVFGVYGIGVDYRHLTIIADYMTSEGLYKPFNRSGLSNHVSPFLKSTYETTTGFLTEAAIFGDFDDLLTPSSSIVLGQPPKIGTNSFDLLIDTKT
ncbi:hypothetical protein O181_031486 [Austropuccinia psidii MF-1]|uniref:DNA-directed RNA polymerase subunit n=1 Tax=Austropuccinia psidii MF-1 TaxID=1389203 RepID=A0A9Q3H587_9BASI|nr:hypothetical protein [Austropuccinia psidii MF-1]